MAKNATNPKGASEAISLEFDLFDLPTAQHKAGLAGLVLLVQSLPDQAAAPKIEALTPTSARVQFTEDSLQTLFDDLYDAKRVEVAVATKWPGQSPKYETSVDEVDAETGKPKKSKRYVYDVVQPKGRFLSDNFADDDGVWLKLWRDMLWNILRGRPTTRIPFNERAERQPCSEAVKVWRELKAFEKAKAKNKLRTCEVAGALLLGAQAVNAEGVPFQGRSDQSLLLHFWQVALLIFVPQVVDQDGKGEFVGYVLAVPEIADLEEFIRLFPRMLRQLRPEKRGYRPTEAVVDLPEQGALEFFYNLGRLAGGKLSRKNLVYTVSAVDFFQMAKLGNNVKTMASGSIPLNESLLDAYQGIRDEYRNPLFRSAALLALLRQQPWYRCYGQLFADRPRPFFVRCDDTPPAMPWFGTDAITKFKHIQEQSHQEESHMPTADEAKPEGKREPAALETIVYRVVLNLVRRKAEEKSGRRYEDFKDKTVMDEKTKKPRMAVPSEYIEAKQKICSDAFLAFRSRRDSDFVDFFTATVGQVGQFLPQEDYRVLAEALMRTDGPQSRDDVKTLAMLALSAASL